MVDKEIMLSLLDGIYLPPLIEELKYASEAEVEAILDHRTAQLGVAHSTVLENHLFVEAVLAAARIVRDSQGDPREVLCDVLCNRTGSGELLPLCKNVLQCAVAWRDAKGSVRYGGVIRKARAYIEEHFSDSGLTLRDVAGHVALSNNHFCTLFSREMGVTFMEYLTSLRIARAGELLRSTNMRTSEVAYAVGYNDPHYFGNLFKRKTGLSPRDYRRVNE